MKKTLALILCGLFLSFGPAYAHHDGKGEHGKGEGATCPAMTLESLTKELKLTKDQQAKVKTALDKKMEQKKAAHEEMHAKMDKIHKDHMDAMNAVLNAEQKKQYEEMMKTNKDGEHCDSCCGKKTCPHEHEHNK